MDASVASEPSSTGSWLDFLTGLVPENVLGLQASAGGDGSVGLSFNVLQILVVAIVIGIATILPFATLAGRDAAIFAAVSKRSAPARRLPRRSDSSAFTSPAWPWLTMDATI